MQQQQQASQSVFLSMYLLNYLPKIPVDTLSLFEVKSDKKSYSKHLATLYNKISEGTSKEQNYCLSHRSRFCW